MNTNYTLRDVCFDFSEAGRRATTFSKLGVQFLGVGYCTEQNTDGIPSFVHCSLLRNGITVITLFIKKVGVVRPNFGGLSLIHI